MNDDRKLLELAAKAAGYTLILRDGGKWFDVDTGSCITEWNPLDDDGDALRLSAKLDIDLEFQCPGVEAYRSHNHPSYEGRGVLCFLENSGDACADSRRVIVRAAAAIGESMP